MPFQGNCNLQVLRGLTSARSLLSCTADGGTVDLFDQDDGSGRQQWRVELVPGRTDVYHIFVVGGVSGDRRYLSCTSDGTKVDLFARDDDSGRQRWRFVPVSGSGIPSYYNIRVDAGVTNGRVLLSCTPDGAVVDLWHTDDPSGRQRWQVQPLG